MSTRRERGLVVGLDAATVGARRGWALVAVEVEAEVRPRDARGARGLPHLGPVVGLAFATDLAPLLAGRLPGLPALEARPLLAVGIDIPVGLVASGLRAADVEGRRALGARSSTLYPIAPRPVVEEPDYDRAKEAALRLTGRKVSKQSHGLRRRILEVDALLRGAPSDAAPWFEVHPELSFAALAGEVLASSKATDGGLAERTRLLGGVGLVPGSGVPTSDAAPRLKRDDVLDAAVAAWTAARALVGRSLRYGEDLHQWDPDLDREVVIHA